MAEVCYYQWRVPTGVLLEDSTHLVAQQLARLLATPGDQTPVWLAIRWSFSIPMHLLLPAYLLVYSA